MHALLNKKIVLTLLVFQPICGPANKVSAGMSTDKPIPTINITWEQVLKVVVIHLLVLQY